MDELCARLAGFGAVSIIGLCKNAGKTTALNHIIGGFDGTALGLTSIGRDGESTDLVTGTAKPGIYIRAGTLFATADGLLRLCDVTREIIENTRISTPLGDVIVARALSDGFVQLAGPSMIAQLAQVKRIFFEHGAQKVLIDGAISRKTLCSRELVEAVVLCAGASCGSDMARVVHEARHACRVLTLPQAASPALDAAVAQHPDARLILTDSGGGAFVPPEGISLRDALRESGAEYIFVAGALTDALLRPVVTSGARINGVTFVARDAARVLLSADMPEKLNVRGARLAVLESVELAAVTCNPFSAYGAHFDAREFRDALKNAVDAPVFDVKDIG